MKKILALMFMLVGWLAAGANPVSWSTSVDSLSPQSAVIKWTAKIDMGYHIYGLVAEVGPDQDVQPTEITINPVDGLSLDGPVRSSVKPEIYADPQAGLKVPVYHGTVTFSQQVKWTGSGRVSISGIVRSMACTDESCTPPQKYKFDVKFGGSNSAAASKEPVVQAQTTATRTGAPAAAASNATPDIQAPSAAGADDARQVAATADTAAAAMTAAVPETAMDGALTVSPATIKAWWEPVDIDDVQTEASQQSFLSIFLIGFAGGLLALLTPCVWPMIPMTMSFFLKKGRTRRKSISDAVTYALSIVVIYLLLGIGITLLFGASQLNKIATSAVFNVIFFVLLVVFAISFFGAFDIKLPSKWSNKMDSRAESTTGILSIFFMAFTLVLVSFSCTGPIIGTLLVEAASQSSISGPAIGMGGFALGLALPFGLFAFFPSLLKDMPKSGGWLNSVKVVLGFIELILSLKFLSVADLAYGWHILDREVFLSIWIVLFVLLGMYLLGKLRFSHDSPSEHTSVLGFFLAVISLSFAAYLVPGLWGAPLKSISAFAPPLTTQDFNLYGGGFREFDNYDEGMEYARQQGKPVFLDFSGYACVNCRKMEGAVFDTQEVRDIIENGFVTITLMTDDRAPLPKPVKVEENGQTLELEEVGELWSYLQRHKFGTSSQPYYVLLDNEGQPLMPARVYDENIDEFVKWLNQGAEKYSNLAH